MGRIIYKSPRDIERMREAGVVVSTVLAALTEAARPGVSTYELDQLALTICRQHGASPSFLGYKGFPGSLCASLNQEVVHGIPSRERVLKDGDVVKLDFGCRLRGFHADSATTVAVGKAPDEVRRLLQVTRDSLWVGIQAIRFRGRMYDLSGAIQQYVEKHGFSVVREMVGHGIGSKLHEEPQIPNYVDPQHPNTQFLDGMTIAIEPMVNAGGPDIQVLPDNWTVVTTDGSVSAHFEHTVAITRNGPQVLTLGPHDSGP